MMATIIQFHPSCTSSQLNGLAILEIPVGFSSLFCLGSNSQISLKALCALSTRKGFIWSKKPGFCNNPHLPKHFINVKWMDVESIGAILRSLSPFSYKHEVRAQKWFHSYGTAGYHQHYRHPCRHFGTHLGCRKTQGQPFQMRKQPQAA